MGMEGIIPTMPQFRESGGGWDWRQVFDMFIPGDVWNSRTNQWRPQGMVAGAVGSVVPFGDMAVEAIYANRDRFGMPNLPNFRNPFSGIGNWLSGRTGGVTEDRGNLWPSARNPMMPSHPSLPDFAGNDNWGTANLGQRDPNWRMPGVQDAGPRPMRGGQGGYDGQSWSSARGLGDGMRRNEQQIMQEQMDLLERMRNRGLMQER